MKKDRRCKCEGSGGAAANLSTSKRAREDEREASDERRTTNETVDEYYAKTVYSVPRSFLKYMGTCPLSYGDYRSHPRQNGVHALHRAALAPGPWPHQAIAHPPCLYPA